MRCMDGITNVKTMNMGKLQEMMRDEALSWLVQGSCKETDITGRLNNNNQVNKMTHLVDVDQPLLSHLVLFNGLLWP